MFSLENGKKSNIPIAYFVCSDKENPFFLESEKQQMWCQLVFQKKPKAEMMFSADPVKDVYLLLRFLSKSSSFYL